MVEQTQIQSDGSSVANDTAQPGASLPANQPQPVPDKLTAILQKQASGQTLTPSDRGYLGAVKRRGRPKTVPAAAFDNPLLPPPPASPAPADNPLFTPAQPGPSPADSVSSPPVDSALIRTAANAICSSLDSVTKIFIGNEAKKAGADARTVDQYKAAVALQDENRQLIVENSEPVVLMLCDLFKTTPDKLGNVLKNAGFFGGLAAHSLAVFAVVKSIKESQTERRQAAPANHTIKPAA